MWNNLACFAESGGEACCCGESDDPQRADAEEVRDAAAEEVVFSIPATMFVPLEKAETEMHDFDKEEVEMHTDEGCIAGLGSESTTLDLVDSEVRVQRSFLESECAGSRRPKNRMTNLDEVDPLTVQLVSFQGRANLLRGSRLCAIMRNGAAIFSSSRGSAATYELSEQVTGIDVFISHNWSVARSKKFICLALYFNFRLALLLTIVLIVVIGVATVEGRLPLIALDSGRFESGVCGTLLVAPLFVSALCFGHKLRRFVGHRSPAIFLDKTCIHQTDKEKQREGINKLGAFVMCSSHIVILYTDVYLKKLWTVYELACFLLMHPTSRMQVVAPYMPLYTLGGIIAMYLSRLVDMAIRIVSDQGYEHGLAGPEVVSMWLMALAFMVLFRHMARMLESARRCLANFEVEDCACTCEEDRPVVYRHIALLMRATGEVDIEATDEEARQAFSCIVSKLLAGPLVVSAGLQYQHCFAVFLCGLFPAYFDVYMGKFPYPEELWARARMCYLLDLFSWPVGLFPIIALMVSCWCEKCLRLSGWCEWAFLACGGLVVTMVAVAMRLALVYLVHAAVHEECDASLLGLALVPPTSTLMAAVGFILKRRSAHSSEGVLRESTIAGLVRAASQEE